jgi:hypothetical protein
MAQCCSLGSDPAGDYAYALTQFILLLTPEFYISLDTVTEFIGEPYRLQNFHRSLFAETGRNESVVNVDRNCHRCLSWRHLKINSQQRLFLQIPEMASPIFNSLRVIVCEAR